MSSSEPNDSDYEIPNTIRSIDDLLDEDSNHEDQFEKKNLESANFGKQADKMQSSLGQKPENKLLPAHKE